MLSQEQLKLYLQAATRYQQGLNVETATFLKERGISKEIAESFSLGTVTDPIPEHQLYQGWLSIPYFTALGICVGFKFRRLDEGKPKYGMATGQKTHLFNVSALLEPKDTIAVCEGELDAIIATGALGIPALGVPGVAAWKPHYAKLMNGYGQVLVIGDNDVKEDGSNPGAEFSRRVASEVINASICVLPAGMDLNDLYLAKGTEETKRMLGAVNV
jgi:DNA primase